MCQTKLTPDTQQAICDYLRNGSFFEDACALVDVAKSTGLEWMQRGRGECPDRPKRKCYADFADAVEKARLECKHASIQAIREAGEKSWQAHAWYLERVYRDQFALTTKTEVTGANGGPMEMTVNGKSELLSRLSGLVAAAGKGEDSAGPSE